MSNQFKLKVIQDTALTIEAVPPSAAGDSQKYPLKAGSEYPVSNFHEVDNLFFRFALGKDSRGDQLFLSAPDGVTRTTWCIFEGHCMLVKADGTSAHQFTQRQNLKLHDFLAYDINLSLEAINQNKVLAIQIQEKLIKLGFLASTADGLFGPISAGAFKAFQEAVGLEEEAGFLGRQTADKLLHTTKDQLPKPELTLSDDWASRIIKYMQAKNYNIATNPGELNIVYLEGVNRDGSLNPDRPNRFNDRRLLIEFKQGRPSIVGNWEATTEPGSYYTYNPISAYARQHGAARIKFGQYKAWQIGTHGQADPHEALVQVGTISVHRDLNRDMIRTGDRIDTGSGFCINQHWGYDYSKNNILYASAGCLVGRTRKGHREFMQLIKKDVRYRLNRWYMFETTIIAGDDLNKRFPPAS